MSHDNSVSKLGSDGISLEDAWVDGVLLSGYLDVAFATEVARIAGQGSRPIFIRGAVAAGLHVAKKLEIDFGLGNKVSDIGRCEEIVMGSVLMPHTTEKSENDYALIRIFDCPYAAMVAIQGDPLVCEFCVGYTRGACERVGSVGVSRLTHIPSGDKECIFEVKRNSEHGLSRYNLVKTLPSVEYLSSLLQRVQEILRDKFMRTVSLEARPVVSPPSTSDEERRKRTLSYIIDLRTRVLGGLAFNQAYNACSIIGDEMTYRICDSGAKMAASLAMNGFPPLAVGWKKKYGISTGMSEAERIASHYLVSMKIEGEVVGNRVEATNCVWYDVNRDMAKTPEVYHMSTFKNSAAERRAIKAGCKSCDACLRTLVKPTGVGLEQTSCLADGASSCIWNFKS